MEVRKLSTRGLLDIIKSQMPGVVMFRRENDEKDEVDFYHILSQILHVKLKVYISPLIPRSEVRLILEHHLVAIVKYPSQ